MRALRFSMKVVKFSVLVLTFQSMPIVFWFLFLCWHTPERILNHRVL